MSITSHFELRSGIAEGSPEPFFTCLETNDVLLQARALPNWQKEYVQITPGKFKGSLMNISLGSVQLFRESMDKAVDQQGRAWPNCLTVGIPLKFEGDGFWCGDKLERNSIFFLKPNSDLKFRSPRFSDFCLVVVDIDALRKYSAETGWPLPSDIDQLGGAIPAPQELCNNLRNTFVEIFEDIGRNPSVLNEQNIRQALLSQVMNALLYGISGLEKIVPHRPGQFVHRHIVEKARDFILSRKGNPPSVLDICNELRVSRRILHYSFQKVLAINPVTFLRYIRLHGARQELITEPPGRFLISEIAAHWGFWTPGIFCTYYKELFGETPTATVRQRHLG